MAKFDDIESFDEDDPSPSKSSIKREAERLKKIGEKLLEMSDAQLESFKLDDKLAQAIAEGKRIKSREGLRRHKQYIGKVMRDVDTEALETRLQEIENAHTLNTRAFHELETLRDELINGDNSTVGTVIERFPGVDTQKLRQLVRNAKKEQQANAHSQDKPESAHARKLFRFLREAGGN
ncbi:MAG: ribosome biogenesis factor YjgA [Pseudomonadota bacterium]|nr:ribosome biogenesis factor YjgA [Pseudomonadota bacterium]